MPALASIRNFMTGVWIVWALAAVALTFVLAGVLTWRTLAGGDLPVDAALGARLGTREAIVLVVAWVPVIVGAAVGHRRWKRSRDASRTFPRS